MLVERFIKKIEHDDSKHDLNFKILWYVCVGIFIGAFGDKLLNTKSSLIIPYSYLIGPFEKNLKTSFPQLIRHFACDPTYECKVLIIHVCGIRIVHGYYSLSQQNKSFQIKSLPL